MSESSLGGKTTPVRAGHAFDHARLNAYLSIHLPEASPIEAIRQFSAGQSNPTFLIESRNAMRFVLRKKPPGELLPSAHLIDREHRIIAALASCGFPVPPPRLFCDDTSIVGTPFYIMDFVPGRVEQDPTLPALATTERRAVYASLMETLATLHRCRYAELGLADFGKQGEYITRQIRRWTRQYEASKTAHIPEMEKLIVWLPANVPAADETTIVHGDYRLGNVILHPREARVVAVLDWELATLGHPLSDLAYSCLHYYLPSDGRVLPGIMGADLAALGIPSEAEHLASYCRHARRGPLTDWPFYVAFSFFRLAAIVQGVYDRGLRGNASASNATEYGERTMIFAKAGWQQISDRL